MHDSEASYAFKKRKIIIPLQLEADYEPEGWLGTIVGMKLYYKCHTKQTIDSSIPKILTALAEHGIVSRDAVDGELIYVLVVNMNREII